MNPRPRILLADDHTILLAAFEQLLSPACEVVGTVTDGRKLLEAAPRLKPDLIVLDISMPLLSGIEACRHLQPKLPDTRWIFLTVNEDPDIAAEALRLGASGFLLKSSAASELFSAIQMAMEGRRYVTPLLTKGEPLGVFLSRTHPPESDKLTPPAARSPAIAGRRATHERGGGHPRCHAANRGLSQVCHHGGAGCEDDCGARSIRGEASTRAAVGWLKGLPWEPQVSRGLNASVAWLLRRQAACACARRFRLAP